MLFDNLRFSESAGFPSQLQGLLGSEESNRWIPGEQFRPCLFREIYKIQKLAYARRIYFFSEAKFRSCYRSILEAIHPL